jgi:AAA domain
VSEPIEPRGPESELDPDGVPWPEAPLEAAAEVYPLHPRPARPHPAAAAEQVRPFVPVDLAELARHGVPAPELLCGGLLYRGGLHSLAGPPDTGKSTLLYTWTLVLLAQGERVVLLDEESGREQVTEKLLALGAAPEHLTRLAYLEFEGRRWDEADRRGLAQLLAERRPALVGFDSAGAFLASAGLDEDKAEPVHAFYKGVLLAAARSSNAAVVVLDHLTKADEGSRYARGSGAKLQDVDVALRLDPIRPFSRAQPGLLKLRVTKDRRGHLVRDHEIRVEVEDGQLALSITPTDQIASTDDPTLAGLPMAARKLLEVLRSANAPLRRNQAVDLVKARYGHGLSRQTVSESLNLLCKHGLIDGERDEASPSGEKRWWAK